MPDRKTPMAIGDELRRDSIDITKAPLPTQWLALLARLYAGSSGHVTS